MQGGRTEERRARKKETDVARESVATTGCIHDAGRDAAGTGRAKRPGISDFTYLGVAGAVVRTTIGDGVRFSFVQSDPGDLQKPLNSGSSTN